MGVLASKAMRQAQRFNAENRAHRFLDRSKPIAAPKYEANVRDLQKVLEDNPDFVESLSQKHNDLDKRLKTVYVTSQDPIPHVPMRPGSEIDESVEHSEGSPKTMPVDRKRVEDFEYGYKEPERVSRGRITLRGAIEFISNHQSQPETWTVQKIAEDYKLKESVVENVLTNFHTFEVFIPEAPVSKNILVHAPSAKLIDQNLEPPSSNDQKDKDDKNIK